MSELPLELHDLDREALVDRLLARFDAVFFELCEQQRPMQTESPPDRNGSDLAGFSGEDGFR